MKFKYAAKNMQGGTVRGVVESNSPQMAADLLRDQKLVPMELKSIKDSKGGGFNINKLFGRVSSSDLANFTRQISTMVTAGLPLTDALNLLKIQSSPSLSPIVGAILADVQSGVALSSAMAKHPKVFSRVYIALVRAGEAAGIMEKIMLRLADNSEKSREFKSKVVGAMIYPIIIMVGMVLVTALMVIVVIPKLGALYKDFDAELPAATQFLIAVSDFSVQYWWLVIIIIGGAFMGFRYYINTDRGKFHWSEFLYRVPVMGPLARQVMLTEMTRTMSLLVSAGVSVVESLMIVSDSVGNVVVQSEIKRVAKQVEKGFPLSISFTESSSFPPLVGQMIAVGEETGKLDDVMAKLSAYFESESSEKVKGLTSAIEPIILIVLAVGVGFLMYAIIVPIYGITNQF